MGLVVKIPIGYILTSSTNEVLKMTNDELKLKEHERVNAEIAKLMAETSLYNKKLRWYEVALVVACTLAIFAVAKLAMI